MLKRFRFLYLLLIAIFRKEWKKFTVVGIFLLIFAVFGIGLTPYLFGRAKATTQKFIKPLYVEALVGQPTTFNPLFSKSEAEKEINHLVFRGLTKVSQGVLVGDLAEKIERKNDTEYVFLLKKDIFWHDGQKFTADDVVYTVELSQNPLYNSEVASNFKDVDVKKIDDYTVSFKLKEIFAPFPTATTIGIIPKHISLTDYRPIGTGDFKFIDIEKNSATLESKNARVKFIYYPTQSVAETALKLGEVHGLVGIDVQNSNIKNWSNFKTVRAVLPYRIVTLYFNTKDEVLKDKPVRQALSYSLAKEEIVKNQQGLKGKIAYNSFPALEIYQKNAKEKYPFNLEKADSLLTGVGWETREKVRVKNSKNLSLTITTLSEGEFKDTAEKIKKAWEKLGIEVNINYVSGRVLKEQIVPNRSFTVLLSSQQLNPDPDQYVLWHTTQTREANVSGIAQPKLDKLLEDGRRNLDTKVRDEKYQEFTRLMLDEAPAVFLYYPNYTWVYSNRIKNIDLKNFLEPSDRFQSIDKWEIKKPLI